MPLLADYAITPDVFDITSYSSEEVCGLCLELIREPMLTEGVVRDLRAGEWRKIFQNPVRTWHGRGKELIRKLATQGRLIPICPVLPNSPGNDQDWCAEALGSDARQPFTGGIIVTEPVKNIHARDSRIARIDRLGNAAWWTARSQSVRVSRALPAYRQNLEPILHCSRSLLFIDPYLDPAHGRYRDIGALVEAAGNRTPAPTIEIHRVCYEGSGEGRKFPLRDDGNYFKQRFEAELSERLRASGLQAEVFIWDDFHDRYLISNLVGVSLPNGFDTTNNPNDITTWTRLGRSDLDDVQREFDPASQRHKLHQRFTIL